MVHVLAVVRRRRNSPLVAVEERHGIRHRPEDIPVRQVDTDRDHRIPGVSRQGVDSFHPVVIHTDRVPRILDFRRDADSFHPAAVHTGEAGRTEVLRLNLDSSACREFRTAVAQNRAATVSDIRTRRGFSLILHHSHNQHQEDMDPFAKVEAESASVIRFQFL
jgi:hypothetical protein